MKKSGVSILGESSDEYFIVFYVYTHCTLFTLHNIPILKLPNRAGHYNEVFPALPRNNIMYYIIIILA